jgi:apolipoprotein N-acyltransferase
MSDEEEKDESDSNEPNAGEQGAKQRRASSKPAASDAAGWSPEPIFGTRAAYGLAFANGILTPVAFAGIGQWYLSFVCWVPLMLAVRGQTPRRALALGWLSGFFQVGIGFYWLTTMLKTFSGFPMSLCVLFASILSLYQGGRIGLLAWASARAEQKGWHPALSFTGAFVLSELVYPLLFPWYSGAAFHEQPALMQTAEIGGPILVSLTLVGFNLALAEIIRSRVLATAFDKRTIVAGVSVMAASLLFGVLRMRSIDALMQQSEPVQIGLVQSNIALGDRGKALTDSFRLTEQVKREGAQLVVWSEATIPQPFEVSSHQAMIHRTLAGRLGLPGVVGGVLYERKNNPQDRRDVTLFNSAFMIDEKTQVVGRYDKQFLLMFGEYLPFGETFPILYEMSPNSGAFTPGESFAPLPHGKHRLATMICYEDIIPSFVNKLVAEGDPDLLVNLTNDRWFQNQEVGRIAGEKDTTEPIQHLALAKLRTIEHRMFMARVSNSGVSALIDANGRVVVQTTTMQQDAKVGEARYMRVKTIYSVIRDYPWWLVSALVLAAGFVHRDRKKAGA